jgi:predicted RNA polymerase sigma factor
VCATDTHCTIEAVWRIEFARVIAGLIRDLDLAEEKNSWAAVEFRYRRSTMS